MIARSYTKVLHALRSHSARCFSSAQDKVIIDVNSKTGVATLSMNNAPVNSLDSEMLTACVEAMQTVEKEKDICGALLTSNFNGKVFSAGLNILDLYEKSPSHLTDFWKRVQDWFITSYGCKKPTVAAINGHALAGGCAFTTFCDYRVMQGDGGKRIGLIEAQLGARVPFFVVDAVRGTVGHNAEQVLLTGKSYTPEEAKEIGLINRVEDLKNLNSVANAHLEKLVALPLVAYSATKMLLRQDTIDRLVSMRDADVEEFVAYVSQPDVQENIGKQLKSLKANSK